MSLLKWMMLLPEMTISWMLARGPVNSGTLLSWHTYLDIITSLVQRGSKRGESNASVEDMRSIDDKLPRPR